MRGTVCKKLRKWAYNDFLASLDDKKVKGRSKVTLAQAVARGMRDMFDQGASKRLQNLVKAPFTTFDRYVQLKADWRSLNVKEKRWIAKQDKRRRATAGKTTATASA